MKGRWVLVAVFTLAAAAPAPRALADDLYSTLKEYFNDALKGEGFLPTPYGADDRYQPKSIWARLDNVAKQLDGSKATKAWVVVSNGRAIYPDDLVPIQSREIDLQVRGQKKERKLALTSALAGRLGNVDLEAGWENDVEIEITLPRVYVDFAYYYDMKTAQVARRTYVDAMNDALKNKDGVPYDRRVILAAVRVEKGAAIQARSAGGASLGAKAKLLSFLSAIGLSWDSKTNTFERLETTGDRYIAFQALVTNAQGYVSSLGGAEGSIDEASRDQNVAILASLLAPNQ